MPAAAVELLDETTPAGAAGARYRCEVDGVLVGYRLRDEAGHIVMETAWGAGAPHGLQREWDSDGSLLFEARYVKGREHGVARQWQDGRLVGTYRMSHGTGVDLWRGWNGVLAEERHLLDRQRHGYERWWSGDDRSVWCEEHYRHDIAHGIFRRWNNRGRLSRGFPRYFVNGERVPKRTYLRRAAVDLSLPPYRPEDNSPRRTVPPEYAAQRLPTRSKRPSR